jgi:hypothetical protein
MSYRNYCSCLNCKDKISTNNIKKHYARCLVEGAKFIGRKYQVPVTLHCQYCDSLRKNENSLRQHEIRCQSNLAANKIAPSYGMLGKKGTNQFVKAEKLGLPKPIVSQESIDKRLETQKKNGTLLRTKEAKKNTSIAMKKAVKLYPESYTSSNRGRVKQIIIDGIKLLGQWEVDFYLWAKAKGLDPKRPTIGFKYTWNGERTYFPDFYLPTLNGYVEVKGYETDRDQAKWKYFSEALYIVKEKEIKDIRKDKFEVDNLKDVKYNSD